MSLDFIPSLPVDQQTLDSRARYRRNTRAKRSSLSVRKRVWRAFCAKVEGASPSAAAEALMALFLKGQIPLDQILAEVDAQPSGGNQHGRARAESYVRYFKSLDV